MTSTEAIIVTLIPTLNMFLFVAIILEGATQKNLTKSWRFSREMSVVGFLSGGIGVKILEVVDWSQVSNQSSQLESVAAARISRN